MTNKEIAQEIRKALKENGYSRKDISVRSSYIGYSSRFDVSIKNPLIRYSEVKEIVKRYENYERDIASGEILEGGNDFVFVSYEYGIFDDVIAELLPDAEKIFNNENYNGHMIAETENKHLHINILNRYESVLGEFDKGEKFTYKPIYYIKSVRDLAIALWRFYNIGTIYV